MPVYMFVYPILQQQALNEENLRKQEESVQKQEAMRKGVTRYINGRMLSKHMTVLNSVSHIRLAAPFLQRQ